MGTERLRYGCKVQMLLYTASHGWVICVLHVMIPVEFTCEEPGSQRSERLAQDYRVCKW